MFSLKTTTCAISMLLLMTGMSSAQTPVTCGQIILAPGHYVLNGDMACVKPIFINSDNVTLDLQGYTLSNANPGGYFGGGVVTSVGPGSPFASTTNGTKIRNGTITGFGTAIGLSGPVGPLVPRTTNAQVHHMTLIGNGRGIYVSFASNITLHNNKIRDSIPPPVSDPDGDGNPYGVGIVAFGLIDSQIKNNEISGSTYDGIALRSSSDDNMVMNNHVSDNGRYGILISDWGGGSSDNIVKNNKVLRNAEIDLYDLNDCDTNLWKNNKYLTKSPDCLR